MSGTQGRHNPNEVLYAGSAVLVQVETIGCDASLLPPLLHDLKRALHEAGAAPETTLRLRIFMTGVRQQDKEIERILLDFFGPSPHFSVVVAEAICPTEMSPKLVVEADAQLVAAINQPTASASPKNDDSDDDFWDDYEAGDSKNPISSAIAKEQASRPQKVQAGHVHSKKCGCLWDSQQEDWERIVRTSGKITAPEPAQECKQQGQDHSHGHGVFAPGSRQLVKTAVVSALLSFVVTSVFFMRRPYR